MESYQPLLLVADVAVTVDFYRFKLGFEHVRPQHAAAWLEGDFAMLRRGRVILMFKAVPGGAPRPNGAVHAYSPHEAFINVKDRELEPLCDELRTRGVKITQEIAVTEHGTREFYFQDNNGYVFCCGHSVE